MIITKTLYKEFLDLPAYAWYHIHDQEKYDWIQADKYGALEDPNEDDISDMGDETEILFLQRYKFVPVNDISQTAYDQQVSATHQAIANKDPVIYQGRLQIGDVYTIFDVLEYIPESDMYRHIEIKSKTSIRNKNDDGVYTSLKKDLKQDISFSAYILEKNTILITEHCFAFLNKEYQLNGELDVERLFVMESVQDEVIESGKIETTLGQITELFKMSFEQLQANYPYEGSKYKKYFASKPPKGTIEIMSSLSGDKYRKSRDVGIFDLSQISSEQLEIFTPIQQFFITRYQKGIHCIESELRDRLQTLEFPLYFYDYETYTSGVPKFQGSRPWQQIVCQYSIHKMDQDGGVQHFEGIIQNGAQNNQALVTSMMKDLGELNSGTFVSWNASFENGRNQELIEKYPEFAPNLQYMIEHTFDLMYVFRDGLYFDPDCQGSNSLKAVLPALTDITYTGMPVSNGMEAMGVIEKILVGQATEEQIRDCLIYCKQDTWAMVAIYQKLLQTLHKAGDFYSTVKNMSRMGWARG